MVDTSQIAITHASYDRWILRSSPMTLKQSRRLLEETAPLVRAIEGGSVIGAHTLNAGEREAPAKPEQQPDG